MGFPLAGGPDDDISNFLSRDLLKQHSDQGASSHAKYGGAHFYLDDDDSDLAKKEKDAPIPLPYHGDITTTEPKTQTETSERRELIDDLALDNELSLDDLAMPDWWTAKDIDPFQSFKRFRERNRTNLDFHTRGDFEKMKQSSRGDPLSAKGPTEDL